MEGYVTWEVTSALNTDGAERPGVRFCHPSASFVLGESYDIKYSRLGEHSKPPNMED
jgi:hypothetical protein